MYPSLRYTGSLDAAFVIARSTEPELGAFTVVSCVELLFEPSGSSSSAETSAVLEMAPPGLEGSTVTSTVTVQVDPEASALIVHLTSFPEVAEQSPPPSWTASTESEAGTESETVTFEAESGPAFDTTRS